MQDIDHEGTVTLPLARYEEMRGKEAQADNRATLQGLLDDQAKRTYIVTNAMHWLLSVIDRLNRGLVVFDGPHHIDIPMELHRMGVFVKNNRDNKGFDIEIIP